MKLTVSIITTLLVVAFGATSCIININDDPSGSCRYEVTNTQYSTTGTICVDRKKSEGCQNMKFNDPTVGVLHNKSSSYDIAGTFNDTSCSIGGYSAKCHLTLTTIPFSVYAVSNGDCALYTE